MDDLWSPTPDALSAYWMPFTANRQFKDNPRLIASAQGMHYTDIDGRLILDGIAGLWCCNAGHGRQTIVEAIQRQAATLDFSLPFQMGHPSAFMLAEQLAKLAPAPLHHVFFTNSGSEAVDTALKIALAYHHARGEGARTRLIGRDRGYHGAGFGGISVGGIANNRKRFGPLLTGVDHLSSTYDRHHQAYSRGEPVWGAHLADELECLIQLHDPSTIAAVIVEPVAGSTGVLIPPQGYLQKLREITLRHGILLIFDEVITGFGRLGAPFAANYFGVTPDMMTLAKGLTNGTVPMGATLCSKTIHQTLMQTPANQIELFHGYTYSAHPLACAAGLATLALYANEALFQRAANLASYWENQVHRLKDARHVIDIRNLGLLAGIELQSREKQPGARAYQVFLRCWEAGLVVRATGDTLALAPSLIVTEKQIDQILSTIQQALEQTD